MKKTKIKELEKLSYSFSDLNEIVKKRLTEKSYGEELVTNVEALEKIDFLYLQVQKMPVWPFNMHNLGRLLIAATIPLLVFVIQLLVNADSIIYNLDKIDLLKTFFK